MYVCFIGWKLGLFSLLVSLVPLFSCLLLEDSPPDSGVLQTNQYSSISPPASPVADEDPFTTYFEEKVPIPENVSQVLMTFM